MRLRNASSFEATCDARGGANSRASSYELQRNEPGQGLLPVAGNKRFFSSSRKLLDFDFFASVFGLTNTMSSISPQYCSALSGCPASMASCPRSRKIDISHCLLESRRAAVVAKSASC